MNINTHLLHTNMSSVGFIVDSVLGGLVAALTAVASTVAIEHYGGVYGGIIGTIPTSVVISCVGIALAADNDAEIQDAVFTIPIGMLINVLFLTVWRLMPSQLPDQYSMRDKLGLVAAVSATAWLLLAWVASEVLLNVLAWIEVYGALSLLVIYIVGLHAAMGQRYAPKAVEKTSARGLAIRGMVVAVSVAISFMVVEFDDVFAGFASVFPYFAIYFITISSLWMSQGEHVPSGAISPLMLGSISTGAYGLIFGIVYTNLSGNQQETVVLACLLSWVITVVCISIPVSVLLLAQQHNVIAALGVISFSSGWDSSEAKGPFMRELDDTEPDDSKLL